MGNNVYLELGAIFLSIVFSFFIGSKFGLFYGFMTFVVLFVVAIIYAANEAMNEMAMEYEDYYGWQDSEFDKRNKRK